MDKTKIANVEVKIGLLQKIFECPICLELMKNPVTTKCDHKFCRFCLHSAIGKQATAPCPLCKEPFTRRSLQSLPHWAKVVGAVKDLSTAFEMDTGAEFVARAGVLALSGSSPPVPAPTPVAMATEPSATGQPPAKARTRRARVRQQKMKETQPPICKVYVEESAETGDTVPELVTSNTNISSRFPVKSRKSRAKKDADALVDTENRLNNVLNGKLPGRRPSAEELAACIAQAALTPDDNTTEETTGGKTPSASTKVKETLVKSQQPQVKSVDRQANTIADRSEKHEVKLFGNRPSVISQISKSQCSSDEVVYVEENTEECAESRAGQSNARIVVEFNNAENQNVKTDATTRDQNAQDIFDPHVLDALENEVPHKTRSKERIRRTDGEVPKKLSIGKKATRKNSVIEATKYDAIIAKNTEPDSEMIIRRSSRHCTLSLRSPTVLPPVETNKNIVNDWLNTLPGSISSVGSTSGASHTVSDSALLTVKKLVPVGLSMSQGDAMLGGEWRPERVEQMGPVSQECESMPESIGESSSIVMVENEEKVLLKKGRQFDRKTSKKPRYSKKSQPRNSVTGRKSVTAFQGKHKFFKSRSAQVLKSPKRVFGSPRPKYMPSTPNSDDPYNFKVSQKTPKASAKKGKGVKKGRGKKKKLDVCKIIHIEEEDNQIVELQESEVGRSLFEETMDVPINVDVEKRKSGGPSWRNKKHDQAAELLTVEEEDVRSIEEKALEDKISEAEDFDLLLSQAYREEFKDVKKKERKSKSLKALSKGDGNTCEGKREEVPEVTENYVLVDGVVVVAERQECRQKELDEVKNRSPCQVTVDGDFQSNDMGNLIMVGDEISKDIKVDEPLVVGDQNDDVAKLKECNNGDEQHVHKGEENILGSSIFAKKYGRKNAKLKCRPKLIENPRVSTGVVGKHTYAHPATAWDNVKAMKKEIGPKSKKLKFATPQKKAQPKQLRKNNDEEEDEESSMVEINTLSTEASSGSDTDDMDYDSKLLHYEPPNLDIQPEDIRERLSQQVEGVCLKNASQISCIADTIQTTQAGSERKAMTDPCTLIPASLLTQNVEKKSCTARKPNSEPCTPIIKSILTPHIEPEVHTQRERKAEQCTAIPDSMPTPHVENKLCKLSAEKAGTSIPDREPLPCIENESSTENKKKTDPCAPISELILTPHVENDSQAERHQKADPCTTIPHSVRSSQVDLEFHTERKNKADPCTPLPTTMLTPHTDNESHIECKQLGNPCSVDKSCKKEEKEEICPIQNEHVYVDNESEEIDQDICPLPKNDVKFSESNDKYLISMTEDSLVPVGGCGDGGNVVNKQSMSDVNIKSDKKLVEKGQKFNVLNRNFEDCEKKISPKNVKKGQFKSPNLPRKKCSAIPQNLDEAGNEIVDLIPQRPQIVDPNAMNDEQIPNQRNVDNLGLESFEEPHRNNVKQMKDCVDEPQVLGKGPRKTFCLFTSPSKQANHDVIPVMESLDLAVMEAAMIMGANAEQESISELEDGSFPADLLPSKYLAKKNKRRSLRSNELKNQLGNEETSTPSSMEKESNSSSEFSVVPGTIPKRNERPLFKRSAKHSSQYKEPEPEKIQPILMSSINRCDDDNDDDDAASVDVLAEGMRPASISEFVSATTSASECAIMSPPLNLPRLYDHKKHSDKKEQNDAFKSGTLSSGSTVDYVPNTDSQCNISPNFVMDIANSIASKVIAEKILTSGDLSVGTANTDTQESVSLLTIVTEKNSAVPRTPQKKFNASDTDPETPPSAQRRRRKRSGKGTVRGLARGLAPLLSQNATPPLATSSVKLSQSPYLGKVHSVASTELEMLQRDDLQSRRHSHTEESFVSDDALEWSSQKQSLGVSVTSQNDNHQSPILLKLKKNLHLPDSALADSQRIKKSCGNDSARLKLSRKDDYDAISAAKDLVLESSASVDLLAAAPDIERDVVRNSMTSQGKLVCKSTDDSERRLCRRGRSGTAESSSLQTVPDTLENKSVEQMKTDDSMVNEIMVSCSEGESEPEDGSEDDEREEDGSEGDEDAEEDEADDEEEACDGADDDEDAVVVIGDAREARDVHSVHSTPSETAYQQEEDGCTAVVIHTEENIPSNHSYTAPDVLTPPSRIIHDSDSEEEYEPLVKKKKSHSPVVCEDSESEMDMPSHVDNNFNATSLSGASSQSGETLGSDDRETLRSDIQRMQAEIARLEEQVCPSLVSSLDTDDETTGHHGSIPDIGEEGDVQRAELNARASVSPDAKADPVSDECEVNSIESDDEELTPLCMKRRTSSPEPTDKTSAAVAGGEAECVCIEESEDDLFGDSDSEVCDSPAVIPPTPLSAPPPPPTDHSQISQSSLTTPRFSSPRISSTGAILALTGPFAMTTDAVDIDGTINAVSGPSPTCPPVTESKSVRMEDKLCEAHHNEEILRDDVCDDDDDEDCAPLSPSPPPPSLSACISSADIQLPPELVRLQAIVEKAEFSNVDESSKNVDERETSSRKSNMSAPSSKNVNEQNINSRKSNISVESKNVTEQNISSRKSNIAGKHKTTVQNNPISIINIPDQMTSPKALSRKRPLSGLDKENCESGKKLKVMPESSGYTEEDCSESLLKPQKTPVVSPTTKPISPQPVNPSVLKSRIPSPIQKKTISPQPDHGTVLKPRIPSPIQKIRSPVCESQRSVSPLASCSRSIRTVSEAASSGSNGRQGFQLGKQDAWSLVATGISKTTHMPYITKFLQLTGAHFCSKFSTRTSHVLVKPANNHELRCQRTLKYFQGVAHGCWVLSVDWVIQCVKQRRLLPPEGFEIVGDTLEKELHYAPQRARVSTGTGLLLGWEVCIMGTFNDLTKEDLVDVARAQGAVCVLSPSMYTFDTGTTRVVLVEKDAASKLTDLHKIERRYLCELLTKEWLLDTIGLYTLQQPDDYKLRTVTGTAS